MQATTGAGVKAAGFALGLLLVAGVLVWATHAWAVPRGDGTVGSDVTFITGPTGELAVPGGPFVRGIDLRPGAAPAVGTVPVRNQTGEALAVTVRALPSIGDLDPLLMVDVTAGSQAVYRGPLSGLVIGSNVPFRLASGQTRVLSMRAWLPGSVHDGYQQRIDDVTVAFDVQPVGA
jgi:hypothetical protein